MNLAHPSLKVVSCAFQFWLALLRFLPKQKCQTFSIQGAQKGPRIEKIYVINLDREPSRWLMTWIFYFNTTPLIAVRNHPIVERALLNATTSLEQEYRRL